MTYKIEYRYPTLIIQTELRAAWSDKKKIGQTKKILSFKTEAREIRIVKKWSELFLHAEWLKFSLWEIWLVKISLWEFIKTTMTGPTSSQVTGKYWGIYLPAAVNLQDKPAKNFTSLRR